MDPNTSLILAALTAGVLAGLKDVASEGIKDAYQALKSLVQRKFQDDSKNVDLLEEHAKDPETWEKPLEKALEQVKAGQDKEILQAAQHLMILIQPHQTGHGKYNIQVTDVNGMVIGDNSQVTMHFDDEPNNKRRK